MKPISKEFIDSIYAQMDAASEEQAKKLVEEIKSRQPYAFEYLASAGAQEGFSREESQWLSYIGVILCKILVSAEPGLPPVRRECIDLCAGKITELVRYLKGGDKEDFSKVIAAMVKGYRQPHLLAFVVGVIKTAQEQKGGISQKNASVFFFFFKIIMDSFIQAAEDGACGSEG